MTPSRGPCLTRALAARTVTVRAVHSLTTRPHATPFSKFGRALPARRDGACERGTAARECRTCQCGPCRRGHGRGDVAARRAHDAGGVRARCAARHRERGSVQRVSDRHACGRGSAPIVAREQRAKCGPVVAACPVCPQSSATRPAYYARPIAIFDAARTFTFGVHGARVETIATFGLTRRTHSFAQRGARHSARRRVRVFTPSLMAR